MTVNIQTIPQEVVSTFKMDEINNQRLFVTLLYKFSNFSQVVATEKIMEVDFVKNNFKENTIKQYLSRVRAYLNTREKNKSIPSYVYKILDDLISKHYQKLRPSENDKYRRHITQQKVTPIRKENTISIDLTEETSNLIERKQDLLKELELIEKQIEAFSITLDYLKSKEK